MASVTVEQLANLVGISTDRLLKQMQEAGLEQKSASDSVSDDEKQTLLGFLKKNSGVASTDSTQSTRITLKRKTHSTLKVASGQGKSTVNVEVRKKRTYVKRATETTADEPLLEETPAVQQTPEDNQVTEPTADSTTKTEPVIDESAPPASPQDTSPSNKKKPSVVEKNTVKPREFPNEKPKESLEEQQRRKKAGRSRKKSTVDEFGDVKKLRNVTNFSGNNEEPTIKRKSKQKVAPRATSAFKPMKGMTQSFSKPTKPIIHEIDIPESISVAELAQKMSVKSTDAIRALMKIGVMATINQSLDQDTAVLLVEELGHKPTLVSSNHEEEQLAALTKTDGTPVTRAAVVTIMGHVDHGKTSLLDYIRRTKVASGEAGGITQHIGAYHVETGHGGVTFLDTPGHAAFTAMRARGAKCTDIVILVVAADDGVKPQTEEAIQHARAAEVPIIVAVNKIDKPEADIERIKNELSQRNVAPEDWGGDSQFVGVSAKEGTGVDALLDAILLQAEILELKAVSEAPASGVVVESRIDKGRGPITTLLIQSGTLNRSDVILVGEYYGRVRAMQNEKAEQLQTAGPSTPVEILGLNGSPNAGDEFIVLKDEKQAREFAEARSVKLREAKLFQEKKVNLDNLFDQIDSGEVSTLNVILKTDVRGSMEAIQSALQELSDQSKKTQIKIISSGVGGITETDANLAMASNAILLGFNVRADNAAKRVIEQEELGLRYYSVIYHLIDDIKLALLGLLSPEYREQILGTAEVRDVFRSPKFGQVAGCMVVEGTIYRNKPIRVLRDDVVIYEGELESLRRFKDDVNEVKNATECGIGVKNYNDVKAGDKIEVYEMIEIKPTLS